MVTNEQLKNGLECNADVMDMKTFDIYGIQEYNRLKQLGLPNIHGGIPIFNEGKKVGVVEEEVVQKILNS